MLRELLITLCMMLTLINSTVPVDAFPLTGGNGVVNATVYGVTEKGAINSDEMIYYIDMSANKGERYSIVLVDSEDIAHGNSQTVDGMSNFEENSGSKYDITHVYNGSFRDTLQIPVQKGTVIKRLKVTPGASDPFSIDWNGVPEISADGVRLQFYSGKSEYTGDGKFAWTFDLKVTNLRNDTINTPSFSMEDTSGWIYIGSTTGDKLVDGEALRFPVKFSDVGASSRPSKLICDLTPPTLGGLGEEQNTTNAYGTVTMDIGGWV